MVNYTREDMLKVIGHQAMQLSTFQEALNQLLNRVAQLAEENKSLKEAAADAPSNKGTEGTESEAV